MWIVCWKKGARGGGGKGNGENERRKRKWRKRRAVGRKELDENVGNEQWNGKNSCHDLSYSSLSSRLIARFFNKQPNKSERPSYNELQTCSMIHEIKIPAKQRS